MLPAKLNYPEFVPDQLLTSGHLNQVFEHLEEQGRLSRTNLIGIGVVCGLELKISADGASVMITKGCGVTSEGYLVSVPELTYASYKKFNAVQDRLYNKFVDSSRTAIFPIDELKQAAVEEGTLPLTGAYLKDKVVLIFVEILEEGSKNCNPNSCDDKGINVTVNFRPLLIAKSDADILVKTNGSEVIDTKDLEELKMRRFDVQSTGLADTQSIFEAFQKALGYDFLTRTEKILGDAYILFSPLLIDLYSKNPFTNLASNFKFLHDNSISDEQLIHLQYYYDLFSDILLAYDELRRKGKRALNLCCPDSDLFPRHLLLGEAFAGSSQTITKYRNHFIPSPILNSGVSVAAELRSLFRRILLLTQKFYVPVPVSSDARNLDGIRITPSNYGDAMLSKRAIPYYYKLTEGADKLLQYWDYEKASMGIEDQNLSYHAKEYNSGDDHVLNPLLYDLEPNNFLRIEGHIGKPYHQALRTIISIKNQHRLPFEVIALSGDVKSLRNQIRELASRTDASSSNPASLTPECQFKDLESLYDTLAAELTCMLCKEMKYFYNLPGEVRQLPAPASTIPQVPLLVKCDPDFRFTANSFGHQFELFYQSIKDQGYVGADMFLGDAFNIAGRQNNNTGLALLYYIQKVSEAISSNLAEFDFTTFKMRHNDLSRLAAHIKTMLSSGNNENSQFTEDVSDHLDAIIYACKHAQFTSIYRDYLARLLYVLMLQKFAFFIRMHPGIQHKAGVTVGGTFILVYHEEGAEEERRNDRSARNETEASSRIRTNVRRDASSHINDLKELEGSVLNSKTFSEKQRLALRDLLENKDVNRSMDSLIEEITDGTVIADFFLPYLCYSDCPPINFILQETGPRTEKPVLDMKLKQYCSDDKKGYAALVSPEGGSLSGEGVTTAADGKSLFNPGSVDLQSGMQKTVTITYTKDSESATVSVVVFQKPVAAFEFRQGRVATQISFASHSQFAEKFEWDFGDGDKSEEENPIHNYAAEGSFTVSLKAYNGICSASSSQELEIKVPVNKTCFPLMEIISAFQELAAPNPRLFAVFKNLFQPYSEIEAFFKELEQLAADESQKQIEFFASVQVNVLLDKWFNELLQLVLNSDLQLHALSLYKVLVNLTMYISCIQTEDIAKANVPMNNVLKLIFKQLNAIKDALPNSPDENKTIMKQVLADMMAELQRINDNQEDKSKPAYLKQMQGLIKLVESFNL